MTVEELIQSVKLFPSIDKWHSGLDTDYHATDFIATAIEKLSKNKEIQPILANGLQRYPTIDLCCGMIPSINKTCKALAPYELMQYIGVDRFTIEQNQPKQHPKQFISLKEHPFKRAFINEDILSLLSNLKDNSVNILLGGFTVSEIIAKHQHKYLSQLQTEIQRVVAKGGFFLDVLNNIPFSNEVLYHQTSHPKHVTGINLHHKQGKSKQHYIDVEELKKNIGGDYRNLFSSIFLTNEYTPMLSEFKQIEQHTNPSMLKTYQEFAKNNINIILDVDTYERWTTFKNEADKVQQTIKQISNLKNIETITTFFANKQMKLPELKEFFEFSNPDAIKRIPTFLDLDITSTQNAGFFKLLYADQQELDEALPIMKQLKQAYSDVIFDNSPSYYKKLSSNTDFETFLTLGQVYKKIEIIAQTPEFNKLSKPIQNFIGFQELPF